MQADSGSTLKRRLAIVDLVRKDGEARVDDLSARLGVSSVTIRSDLNYLEGQGYVVRAFGKAKYNPALQTGNHAAQEGETTARGAGEAQVATAAMRWITDGMSLFFSSGGIVLR